MSIKLLNEKNHISGKQLRRLNAIQHSVKTMPGHGFRGETIVIAVGENKRSYIVYFKMSWRLYVVHCVIRNSY
jgi:hypothetical protein